MRSPCTALGAVVVVAAVLVAAAPFGGCSCEPLAPLDIPDGCSPLLVDNVRYPATSPDGERPDCGLPYPSDVFLVDDATMPTGKRIAMAPAAKMITGAGLSADVHEQFFADGFSLHGPIVWAMGVAVDPESVPGIFDDPALTAAAGAPTALIETDSGRRVPHFIDVDPRALVDDAGVAVADGGKRQGLIMHALEQLRPRTRYVVAVSAVRGADGGGVVAPSEAFRRLREGRVGEDPVLQAELARMDARVWPVVERAGLARADVQLAWDFTTGSAERPMQDMLEGRAAAIAELERTPPVVEIDTVFEGDDLAIVLDEGAGDDTWRMVRGFITGPRVVDDDGAGARIARDAEGHVAVVGTQTFSFTAMVPVSVRDSFAPRGVLLYGHGFFGEQDELEGGSARALANATGRTAIAIDWAGMSADDVGIVVGAVGGEVSKSLVFGERVVQGMVNWQTVTFALRAGLFDHDDAGAFRRPARGQPGTTVVDGGAGGGTRSNAFQPFIDAGGASVNGNGGNAGPITFVGISQGHVLGGVLSAVNADIERSVLMVGGASFTLMMFRARPFDRFLGLLNLPTALPDPLDQQKLAAHMASQFDRFDPATYARFVLREPLPLGPDADGFRRRQLLQLMGVGDSEVPNVGSEMHARLLGIAQLTPSPAAPIFGLEQVPFPVDAAGAVGADKGGLSIYDVGDPVAFYGEARPGPEETRAHELLRRLPELVEQMRTFYDEGRIETFCDGPCVLDE